MISLKILIGIINGDTNKNIDDIGKFIYCNSDVFIIHQLQFLFPFLNIYL